MQRVRYDQNVKLVAQQPVSQVNGRLHVFYRLDAAGLYQLKFDLVSEGIDWFEACGSPVTVRPFVVA